MLLKFLKFIGPTDKVYRLNSSNSTHPTHTEIHLYIKVHNKSSDLSHHDLSVGRF